ncbi:hypothetical protein Q4561_00550 [Alteromonas sp. 1_MG-2023]|uniref:hypothetical protein n=1 Tax=Alteromonas sp. 1_MG-2023 TaxID=3062669 RepID=UPI0026E2156D|nr:hypothetical protein [Alteromonas sp. 1_MG-2023]MDO6565534.1 hypothetical protein [Alteromonas sp. 1_MG-2023]|tara:strand:- start:226 stop:420 length:195 start_codon:yes stop_codon:yes gene_type:complete
MRLPTKQLISKIETLSNDLSQDQLSNFLDIINAMTALVEEASELSNTDGAIKIKEAPAVGSIIH